LSPDSAPIKAKSPPQDSKPNLEDVRRRALFSIGQIALAMAAQPQSRDQTLADLQGLAVEPLLRDRIAVATAKSKGKDRTIDGAIAGLEIWASVSDDDDAKIRQQIQTSTFPVGLKPEEWASGDKEWLPDFIAPSRKQVSAVVANVRQIVPSGGVCIHPAAARQLEPEQKKHRK
jgi:cytolysin-activating lysine-acyltransferase